MLGKRLIKSGAEATGGANTFASENFNTVLYTGTGSSQRIGGYINRGAVFNGSSSSILLPSNIDDPLRSANSFGISLWFKTPSGNQVNSYGGKIISLLNDIYCFISIETNNTLLARVQQSNSTSREVTTTALSANTWYHIVFTGNSTNGVTLYLNNSSQGNVTWDGTFLTYTNSNYKFNHIGYQGSNISYLTGTVDQVRFFKKGLSSSEVTTLYGETHSSTTISTTDIFSDNSGVALYQLDGNANDTGLVAAGTIVSSNKIIDLNVDSYTSGTTIDDSTSNNNDATIVGDVSYDNWLGRGRFDLQGSSDYLKIDASTTFNGATDLTLEGWFRPDNLTATDHFFAIYNTSGSSNKLYLRLNDTDGDIDMHAYGSGSASIASLVTSNSSARVQANKWNHIVGVWESGTAMSVYINGVLAGTTASMGNLNTAGTEDLYIGVLKGYIGTYDFDGEVGEIRGYSSALTASEVLQNFNATRYYYAAYDGTASNVTYQEATKFQPDLVWIKSRNIGYSHSLQDTVRGTGTSTVLNTDLSVAEGTYGAYGQITSFDTNGFTVASGGHSQYGTAQVNDNGYTYVAWCFNAGSGSSGSNTDGTITSTVKANTDAGFSIVKWTTNGSASQNVGHGLSSIPELIFFKRLDSAQDWFVETNAIDGGYDYANLNTTAAFQDGGSAWSTRATSTTITAFTSSNNLDYIAYCFHSVTGYQKIGTYDGTGADGNFIETGFQPAFILFKRTDSGDRWLIADNKRADALTNMDDFLDAQDSAQEGSFGATNGIDFLSDGFSINTTDGVLNASSGNYIYLAIAADPDTTTPTVENSFDVVTYTGNGSTSNEVETDFKPDLVWVKSRSSSAGHSLVDRLRGDGTFLDSSATTGNDYHAAHLRLLDNGFDAMSNPNSNNVNYVAWAWKAGDHDDNLPEINTEGTIDSTVSVNDAAGFSIVKYTGNATDDATVGTGLTNPAELVIVKDLDNSNYWVVGGSIVGNGKTLYLNDTTQALTRDRVKSVQSNTFTLGSHFESNGNNVDFIAYCWYSVTGHSKIGTYEGNGSTSGPIVSTGFQPRWILIKNVDQGDNWIIFDSQRDTTNPRKSALFPNYNIAEVPNSGRDVDFNSTGFQIKQTHHDVNASGETYLYMTIA